jgi:hypothetical protein
VESCRGGMGTNGVGWGIVWVVGGDQAWGGWGCLPLWSYI